MIDLTISVASYNTREITKECLSSIFSNTERINFEVIVVDNASTDGSVEMIKKEFSSVILVENKTNVGFGRAHNTAFKMCRGRYFLILNSDTYVYPETLRQMTVFMDKNPDVGICGFKTYWNKEKQISVANHTVPTLSNSVIKFTDLCKYFPESRICKKFWAKTHKFWQADKPIYTEGVDGGAIFVRREAFEKVEGFDENFFFFWEECDLYRRIRKHYPIVYIPDIKILHLGAVSHRGKEDIRKLVDNCDNLGYYYRKHYGLIGLYFLKISLYATRKFLGLYRRLFYRTNTLKVINYNGQDYVDIRWDKNMEANSYILEFSYVDNFSGRGGLILKDNVFRFPCYRILDETIFYRVLSLRRDGTTQILEAGALNR